jgi:hypothetical protein
MKGAFDETNFQSFLSDLIGGRGGLEDLKAKIVLKKVDPWDGQDA